jgi:hypothetical protein
MTTKGDLKDDLAPFVDEIKLMAKLPDGTICDIGEGHYRWDRDYDEAVWVLDLTPRATQFASSALETPAAPQEYARECTRCKKVVRGGPAVLHPTVIYCSIECAD